MAKNKDGQKRSLQQYTLELCSRSSATATSTVKHKASRTSAQVPPKSSVPFLHLWGSNLRPPVFSARENSSIQVLAHTLQVCGFFPPACEPFTELVSERDLRSRSSFAEVTIQSKIRNPINAIRKSCLSLSRQLPLKYKSYPPCLQTYIKTVRSGFQHIP